ncbi:sn-glycerol-3-phosphate import ATP-binding protein UgpC (plasmid) [Burkholderia sp. AD24]|nr:sn-glycerol-3-phosphate import ATP-binding protein UgpC [Burkholderia sp. AD24]
MASVKLVELEKQWDNVVGVSKQSLDIEDGEFIVLLGPSGCGKTTTMRMVAGLEEPTSGQIWIGDRDVTDASPAKRDIAMVFQNYGLYPHMTVEQNIGYPLKLRGVSIADRAEQVAAVAKKVELQPLLKRFPKELSGGQRQRVALARAIVRKPKVFLLDEPLSNLDAKLRVAMRAEIRRLHEELGVTTIYVTHDQIEAMTLADRVVVMRAGVIQQIATPERMYNDPANLFVAGFVGSPPMNLIHGAISNGRFVADTLHVPVAGFEDRPNAVLGVRPEDVSVEAPESTPGHVTHHLPIYMFELTGDAVLVTVELHGTHVFARGSRHLRRQIGDHVDITFDPSRCYLFDATSGERLRPKS